MKNNHTAKTHTWTQKSPFGDLIVSAGKNGVSYIELRGGRPKRRPHIESVAKRAPAEARAVSASLAKYFAGDAHALDRLPVDLRNVQNEFHRKVLTTLRRMVKPGATISYGELAEAVGHPGAARAVGSAMANNPVPLILPCHRVLASGGTLGGYGGGLDMKRRLLALEGVQLNMNGRARR
jgi:methylated-DNA-[protein]-cysteine S-methyltransferase